MGKIKRSVDDFDSDDLDYGRGQFQKIKSPKIKKVKKEKDFNNKK